LLLSLLLQHKRGNELFQINQKMPISKGFSKEIYKTSFWGNKQPKLADDNLCRLQPANTKELAILSDKDNRAKSL